MAWIIASFRPALWHRLGILGALNLGCAGADTTVPDLASVRLDPPAIQMLLGASYPLAITATDANGDPVGPAALQWNSSDARVVWVSAQGRITAIGVGEAAIRASFGPASDDVAVHVLPPGGPPAVAAVAVAPTTSSVLVGGTQRFVATPRDSAGGVISGLPVDWHTTDPAIATVTGDGTATGVAEGTTRVVATVAGVSNSARFDVATNVPSPGTWPNEPAGYSVVSDQSWSILSTLEWIIQFGTATLGLDLTAPASPPSVLTITYPVGFAGGSAPGTLIRDLPNARRVFMGLWWKASDPWQGHESNVNKIQFLFPSTGGDITMVMYGPPGGPYQLRVIPQFPGHASNWLLPNVAQVPVTLGTWHRIEWLVDYGDQVGVGTVRWWLDGQLIGDHSDVPFPDGGMLVYKISPTWGGVGDTKQQVDYFWFDQTYLSRR
jgi:hypothetical protein